jgi:hypothetical protein
VELNTSAEAGGTGAWVSFELTDDQRRLIRDSLGKEAGAICFTLQELATGRYTRSTQRTVNGT